MHCCSNIAATEGRADFSPWAFPTPMPYLLNIYTQSPEGPSPVACIKFGNLEVPKHKIWALFVHPALSFLGKSKVCMQSLLNQTASKPYHSICHAGWKKPWKLKNLFLQETEIKDWEKKKEAQLSLKRHSVSKGTQSPERGKNKWSILRVKKFPQTGSWLLVAVAYTQIPSLECQHHRVQSMAETGECCFLKVIAHYHSWLQQ